MILEGLFVLGSGYALYDSLAKDDKKTRAFKRNVKDKWSKLMDSLGSSVQNKIEQRYEILDIIPKKYGFDSIIGLPIGISCNEFRKLIPLIQQSYKAEVIAEPSNDKNSVYMRCHINGCDISEKDLIRFKWYKFFNSGNKFRNDFGQTFNLDSVQELKSPNKDVIGYRLIISIPNQLAYSDLQSTTNDLSKLLNKCFIEFNNDNMKAECSVITNPIDNKTKFAPIKVKPWQLYVGMSYDYKPIVFDYKISPNGIIAGTVGSGKTVSLIMAFANLCNTCDDFDLYIGMMSEKEDLRIFQNVKQCKMYCNNELDTVELLRYLNKEMDRRNKLFAKCETYCSNIHKYNTLVNPKDRLKIVHFVSDEIADLMECPDTQELLWNLIRKSRSAGIYLTMATQRATKDNLNPEIKAQLSNKLCFNMSNTASALTILSGDGLCTRAVALDKSREFIADYNDGIKIGKTLYLSEEMMVDLLKDKIIIPETANIKKQSKNDKNTDKLAKNEQKIDKKQGKVVEINQFKNINK